MRCSASFTPLSQKPLIADIVLVRRRQGVGQKGDCDAEFIVRLGKIIRLQCELAAGQRALPLQDRRLPSRDFAFGDVAHILRRGGPTRWGEEQDKKDE